MEKEKLTKAAIIENLHDRFMDEEDKRFKGLEMNNLSRGQIHAIVDSFFEEVKNGLINDQTIELRGFGTFEIRTRKGREKARNPKTGHMVSVQTHGVAVFRPGKEIKEKVWDIRQGK